MKPLCKKYGEDKKKGTFVQKYARLELYYELDPRYTRMSSLIPVTSASDACNVLSAFITAHKINTHSQEKFFAIYLNRNLQLLSIQVVNVGTMQATLVDTIAIVKIGLDVGVSKIIVAHNHPSGNLTPSPQDKETTRKLKEQLGLFDIVLTDHLIFCAFEEEYYSFADEGIL